MVFNYLYTTLYTYKYLHTVLLYCITILSTLLYYCIYSEKITIQEASAHGLQVWHRPCDIRQVNINNINNYIFLYVYSYIYIYTGINYLYNYIYTYSVYISLYCIVLRMEREWGSWPTLSESLLLPVYRYRS